MDISAIDYNKLGIKLLDFLDQEFFGIIFRIVLISVTFLLLKSFAEAIANYILFRLDPYTCIGSPVQVYGKDGVIKSVSIFTITIETPCGFIRIPTKSWKTSQYILLKGYINVKYRRSTDKKNSTYGD